MAYSRWDRSKWFVFGSSPESVGRDEQQLTIWAKDGARFRFTYRQLKTDLDVSLLQVAGRSPSTSDEINELRGYVLGFLEEVEGEAA